MWADTDLSIQICDGIGKPGEIWWFIWAHIFWIRAQKKCEHSSKAKQKQSLTAFSWFWFIWIFMALWAEVSLNDLVYSPEHHIQENFILLFFHWDQSLVPDESNFFFFGKASFPGLNIVLFCRHQEIKKPSVLLAPTD